MSCVRLDCYRVIGSLQLVVLFQFHLLSLELLSCSFAVYVIHAYFAESTFVLNPYCLVVGT
jgi:hypothetical protein